MIRHPVILLFSILSLLVSTPALSAARVTASDGAAGDHFGAALATEGEWVAVGAPGADVDGNAGQGAVYLFTRKDCDLTQVARLVATDGTAGDGFGGAVAMGKDLLLIGAEKGNGPAYGEGAVYVFKRDKERWQQVDKLYAETHAFQGSLFGASVATDGETILVGAPEASGEYGPPGSYTAGAVYVFEKEHGDWQQAKELRPESSSFMEEFGRSVSVEKDVALVGGPGQGDHSGNFYVFRRDHGDWTQAERLAPGAGTHGTRLGGSLVQHGRNCAIGAEGGSSDDTYMSGIVWTYRIGGDALEPEAALWPDDWQVLDEFGHAIVMSDSRMVISASGRGKLYLYTRENDAWQPVTGIDAPVASAAFGEALALAESIVIAGAPNADVNGADRQGAVYLYAYSDYED